MLDHQQISPNIFRITLYSEYLATHAQPGQFVEVRVSKTSAPLLRRPISFHRIAPEHKTFELLYEVIGQGTETLSRSRVSDEIDVLGPLGTGFTIDPAKKLHILVGGGMGAAPLLALAETLKAKKPYVLIGGQNKDKIYCEKELKAVTDQVLIATDEGSYGRKGFISDLLIDFLDNQLTTHNFPLSTIYTCGPRAMLKAVSEIAFQKKIDCQVSMEERMACGIGTCLGCVVKTKSGYQRVCKEGPVFNSGEIIWE